MPSSPAETLREIEAALSQQNNLFAQFVETFGQLPADTRIELNPAVLAAIDGTSELPTRGKQPPLGALRA
jgi:hypothetical protein